MLKVICTDFELFENEKLHNFLRSNFSFLRSNLCLAAQFVQERMVGDETVLVLLGGKLLQHLLGVLLGDLVTKVAQDVLELGQHDGTILVLVVQLAELNVVMVVTSAVGLLDGLLHELDDLIVLAELLASVIGLAVLDGDLLDDVHAQGVEDIHEVVHVNLAFCVPIIDGADFLDLISVDRHDFG